MAVTKNKDMSYKTYVRAIAEAGGRPSDIELTELSGYLLRRDIDAGRTKVVETILASDAFDTCDMISALLIAESPEKTEDLANYFKKCIVGYYYSEMESLIQEELKELSWEKRVTTPNEEPHDPVSKYI